jgi:two-component system chemotaxis response regulator CheY
VIQGIRAAGSQVPIIMATAEAEKSRVLEAITAGVSDYIVKPFTPDALRDKLAKYVS